MSNETFEQGELFPRISLQQQEKAEEQIIEEQKVIDYQIREYPIDVIILKYTKNQENDDNEIFIPTYQRKFVWDEKKQSRFIESIMLGLPIPYIFTADKDGRMEVVDGSQRIRALEAFYNNRFSLEDLKILTQLNGFRHKDLSKSRQRRFNGITLRLINLTEKATLDIRKEMFSRINTTPTLLSDMEVRKGVYEGRFYDFIKECSENTKFKILCPISQTRSKREEHVEMVLRFFAYAENYQNFVHIVRDFLDEYMESKKEGFEAEKMANDFEDMLDFVYIHFPHGFKKSLNAKSTPRVRFESLSVGVYLALQKKPDLIPANPVKSWLYSDEFMKHTRSDSANNKNQVIARIEYVRDKLLEK